MADWPNADVPADEQRIIRFQPGYHRCDQRSGIGSVTMMWVLRVGDWAMTWDTHTDWGLPDRAFKAASPDCVHPAHQRGYPNGGATGGAVDWHSPVPLWEDHEQARECCPITGTACYINSGFILGDELFDLLRTEGDAAVWKRLRELLDTEKREVTARG